MLKCWLLFHCTSIIHTDIDGTVIKQTVQWTMVGTKALCSLRTNLLSLRASNCSLAWVPTNVLAGCNDNFSARHKNGLCFSFSLWPLKVGSNHAADADAKLKLSNLFMHSTSPLKSNHTCQDWCAILQNNFYFKTPLTVGTIHLNVRCYHDV